MPETYVASYPGGIYPPGRLELSGEVPWVIDRALPPPQVRHNSFAIDWLDRYGNVLLHVNPRPDERVVALNSSIYGTWLDEVVVPEFPFPLELGARFRIRFDVLRDHFQIAVDGRHLCEFVHRAPPSAIAKVRASALLSLVDPRVEKAVAAVEALVAEDRVDDAIALAAETLELAPDDAALQEIVCSLLGTSVPPAIRGWRTGSPLLGSLALITRLHPLEIVKRLYAPGPVAAAPVRELDQPLRIRPGSSDLFVLVDTFLGRHHLPPRHLEPPATIVDLGAHIGTTMMHFATLYPGARVVGIELDAENATLARANTSRWGSRVEIVHAAASAERGRAAYRREPGEEFGYAVAEEGTVEVEAITIDDVLERLDSEEIDFLKMDVEGSERELLKAGGRWAARTRCLKVELHGDYESEEAQSDLTRLGFCVAEDERHGDALVAWRARDPGRGAVARDGEVDSLKQLLRKRKKQVESLEARLERAEARDAEMRQMLLDAQNELIRRRGVGIRLAEMWIRRRALLAASFPRLAQMYRRLRGRG